MQHFKTITDYCKAIQIKPPQYPHFDIRRFEDNMSTVVQVMPPFRHEFYAIAIKADGQGKAITGHYTDFPEGASIFFNSPFQILSWEIKPDWQGYYIMFSQDFLAQSKHFNQILADFPFLKIDKATPFEVAQNDLPTILSIYHNILQEYQGKQADKFQMIEAYVWLLLTHVKRAFNQQLDFEEAKSQIRMADLKLLARFQTLIQTSFYPNAPLESFSGLHSPSYYAEKLNVHPNHLNAVVKNITGQTALKQIHNHLLQLAKAYLVQTDLSVKEIAYTLFFDSPNNFSTFFKKQTGITPLNYRK